MFICKLIIHRQFIRERNIEKVVGGKRASENQKEYLVNYLEENLDIAHDKFLTANGAKFVKKNGKR